MRPCSTCGTPSKGTRCGPCGSAWERRRGTFAQRQAWRAEVFSRAAGRCEVCRSTEQLEADHIVPLVHGGAALDPANGRALCHRHHVAIGKGRGG
jgi:5-methylcytosine-specific restriction endonuclease McrA